MHYKIRSITVAALAAVLALSSFGYVPAQAAGATQPQAETAAVIDLSARSRHHRHHRHYSYRHRHHHHGNSRAGLYAFGAMLGVIGGLAAADQCRHYGNCYGYGPRYYQPYYYRY